MTEFVGREPLKRLATQSPPRHSIPRRRDWQPRGRLLADERCPKRRLSSRTGKPLEHENRSRDRSLPLFRLLFWNAG